jgi:phospholipase/carboxylesterase
MDYDYRTETISDLIVRLRIPNEDGKFPVLLLLHGWTGDENSMWIFESRLPQDSIIIAPRGIYPSSLGGYGWQKSDGDRWPDMNDFTPAVNSIVELISDEELVQADSSRLYLVGFSQGAALAYAIAIKFPERVSAIAALSGFLPNNVESTIENTNLNGLPIYITHGSQDDLVPVDKARFAVETLTQAGAKVSYCEEEVGHKLSATCFNGMESFFNSL